MSHTDAPSEAVFLRTLRDVLAPPGGASQPFTEEQAAGLDAINERLMVLNRLPSTSAEQEPFCWYRVTLDITDEYETVYSTDGERPDGKGWKPLYESPLSETPRGDTVKTCRHGWRGTAIDMQIQTPCPACGAKSLFIGEGGHLTCARVPNDHNDGCDNPSVEQAVKDLQTEVLSRTERLGTLIAEVSRQAPPVLAASIFSAAKAMPPEANAMAAHGGSAKVPDHIVALANAWKDDTSDFGAAMVASVLARELLRIAAPSNGKEEKR